MGMTCSSWASHTHLKKLSDRGKATVLSLACLFLHDFCEVLSTHKFKNALQHHQESSFLIYLFLFISLGLPQPFAQTSHIGTKYLYSHIFHFISYSIFIFQFHFIFHFPVSYSISCSNSISSSIFKFHLIFHIPCWLANSKQCWPTINLPHHYLPQFERVW